MNDPTLEQALSTRCKRCGGMPVVCKSGNNRLIWIECDWCGEGPTAGSNNAKGRTLLADKWVEMNKTPMDMVMENCMNKEDVKG